jgi:hypothetical protein
VKRYVIILALTCFIIFLNGCDKGISPEPEALPKEAGFGGSIIFKGNWPQGVTRTHIVAFRTPLLSSKDFNILNLAFVSDSIPYSTRQIVYSSLINPTVPIKSGNYAYLAVAQSKTPALSLERKDWYIIGVYYVNNDTTRPGVLNIPADTFIPDINITCDFNNPPSQPPF